jgi:hypothetical protein
MTNDERRMTNDERHLMNSALDTQQSIDLHIDELALHGFEPADRELIAAAVERALLRLLTERGLPPRLAQGGVAQIDGGSFEVAPGSGAEAIGAQVAQAIYGGLGR